MASSREKIKLYSYWRSSCSWRVRIALAYKGIPYEYKAVNVSKGDQFAEEFKRLNRLSTVPVLEDNGFILADSFAILEYLEEKYPEPRLLPTDLYKRALVRQVVNHIAASIQPLQNLFVLKKVEALVGPEQRQKWAQDFIESGFSGLQKVLEGEAGKHCFGDEFTMADAVLVPQISNALRYGVDMEKFPLLKKVGDFVMALPWVEESLPESQPDYAYMT